LQLGPKAKEFLKNKQSFVLKIRFAKRGIGAARSKKGLQPLALASTISTRKKRARLQAVDDPVEPFSPDINDTNFDDIDVELEPQEPHTDTLLLVQAPRLRSAPSIQVVEDPTEDASDLNEECYKELYALRDKVLALFIRWFLRAHIMSIVVR
jgi:hypothetical protein